MDGLLQDVRHAVRALRRRPGFTLTALLTLAIGIGANAAVFTIVDALLLRPLPFGDRSARVVSLHSTHPTQAEDWPDARLSGPDLDDLRRSTRRLEDVAGYLGRNFTVAETAGLAERVRGGGVTPNLFPLLGVQPALGRHFLAEEAQPIGLEPTVILSHGLWQSRFGGDPAIVGKPILVNQRARTVVGVMPAGFRFPERDDLWLPLAALPGSPRDQRMLAGIGVLRSGVTLAQLQAELDGLAASLAARHPSTNREWGLRALMYRDLAFDRAGRVAVFSLMGAVVLVLLIGCANLSNLLLAAGVARQREIAVRAAIGASRARIVREMLAEGLVLSAAGGLLGAALGRLGLDALVASWPEELPYWIHFDVDARVVGFLAVIVVVTAIAFGLLPALRASRPDLIEQLKEGARSAGSRADRRLQGSLVVAQVALCLALLVGANLMIRTFLKMQSADPGFDETTLASLRLYLPGDAYNPVPAKAAFVRRAVDRLRALPGVAAAAATTSIPADDGGLPIRIVPDGRTGRGRTRETARIMIATVPSLFDTLGVRLGRRAALHGRRDGAGGGARRDRQWKAGPPLLAGRQRSGTASRRGGAHRPRPGLPSSALRRRCNTRSLAKRRAQSGLQVYVPYGADGGADHSLPRARDSARSVAAAPNAGRALAQVEAASARLRRLDHARAARPHYLGAALLRRGCRARLPSWPCCSPVSASTACSRTRSPAARGRSACVLPWARRPSTSCVSWWGRPPRWPASAPPWASCSRPRWPYLLQGILYGVSSPTTRRCSWERPAMLVTIVIGASALPARRATRIDPVDALRQD